MLSSSRAALVTGGTSGIGLACALRLKADGLRVSVLDLPTPEAKERAELHDLIFIGADLRDPAACRRAIEEAVWVYSRLDVLVNNAGMQHVSPIPDFPEERWHDMIALMLSAPFLLGKYAWPHLSANGSGRIVNVASIHARVASPFKSAYVTAKHGLLGLTKSQALEGAPHGLTANAVCPAYVSTPLLEGQIRDQARTRGLSEQDVIREVMLAPAAVKRLLAPEDVAALLSYVVSEAAWGMTGAALDLDLGWTAQ